MHRSLITSLSANRPFAAPVSGLLRRQVAAMTYSSFKFKVTGKVQGVFFRAGTIEEAKKLGVVGHVENASDGSVTGEAQGDAQPIAQMKEWLQHTGPSGAKIDKCNITDEKDNLEKLSYSSFEKH